MSSRRTPDIGRLAAHGTPDCGSCEACRQLGREAQCIQIVRAGLSKERRQEIDRPLPGLSGEGRVEAAIAWLGGGRDEARKPDGIDGLRGYREKRRPDLPVSKVRQEARLGIASHRVAKFHEGSLAHRCTRRGRSGTLRGVAAWAGREAARRHGERDNWRQDRKLPDGKPPPQPSKRAA